jgi:SAM-dependent methyltransferase
MSRVYANRPYNMLARYYDLLFTFHLHWYEEARRRLLRGILRKGRSACDLACGTGTTALALADRGMRVIAVDVSATMCRLARQKVLRAHASIRVLHDDMRSFRLPETVDLVLCEFDAINHVHRKSDLASVARAAARALNPGGYFYFDVNNRKAFKELWPGAWWTERPGVALVLHGGYDSHRDKGWTNAEWFLRNGRHWRRVRERIEQVCWSKTEIRRALSQAGFARIRSWDATPFFRGDRWIRPGCRTFYVARKVNTART